MGRLILTFKEDEGVYLKVGDVTAKVTVHASAVGRIRLVIEAPKEVEITRIELGPPDGRR